MGWWTGGVGADGLDSAAEDGDVVRVGEVLVQGGGGEGGKGKRNERRVVAGAGADEVEDGRGRGGGEGAGELVLGGEGSGGRLREEAGCRDDVRQALAADGTVDLVVSLLAVSVEAAVSQKLWESGEKRRTAPRTERNVTLDGLATREEPTSTVSTGESSCERE
jgi:hypothetical protein